MKRRIVSLLLATVMVLGLVPMTTAAEVTSFGDFDLWPDGVTADSKTATYNMGDHGLVKYYEKGTKAQYDAYLTKLESNGYAKAASYTVGDNAYALYQKEGAYCVYVSYLAKVDNKGFERMRVIVEPFGNAYDLDTIATSASVCDTKLWQLDVDNAYSDEDGGMGYVIRLTDGSFIVIDGGYNSDAEANNLYAILSANNPNSGKPVIRGKFNYGCSGYRDGCKFRVGLSICQRVISKRNVQQLLETGRTAKIKNFISKKSGKSFDAYLRLEEGNAVFDFSQ